MDSRDIGYFRRTANSPILFTVETKRTSAKNVEREMHKSLALMIVALATGVAAPAAVAGQCPPDKTMANATKPDATPAKGVTDTVLAAMNLADEPAKIENRMFRLRKLTIAPGGVVPWHSHGDRPAIIYIVTGEVTEYASNCAVPIVHKAGDVARETHVTAHWWKNGGKQPVVLLSADLLHDATDHNM
jgi:quercetin dioxygenase-like cupin family protein